MKLLRALILAILLLTPGIVFAGSDWCRPSATQTADAAITTSGGLFHGIIVSTDSGNAVTLNIYDNATAASGTKLIPTDVIITTSSTDRIQAISIDPPVRFYNGIYVDITCGGTVGYMVYYESEPQ